MYWVITFVGLFLNCVGSILMIVFEPVKYNPKDRQLYLRTADHIKARYYLRQFGIGLLLIGFLLQIFGYLLLPPLELLG